MDLSAVNQLDQQAFVALLGPVFEDTPQIAAAVWPQRPFATVEQLHGAMVTVMQAFSEEEKLRLIGAHPDLGSRAKMAAASVAEQASAGLDQLSLEEFERFQALNTAYKDKFDFPFIIAVKHHTKASILEAFERRLGQEQAVEQATALAEIAKIAASRLADLVDGG